MLESEGGVYSGEMKFEHCTHLIINKPVGQKYAFAKKWQLSIVRSDWVLDSIQRRYCQEEDNYKVSEAEAGVTQQPEGFQPTSTPTATSTFFSNTLLRMSCLVVFFIYIQSSLLHICDNSCAFFHVPLICFRESAQLK